MKVGSEGQAEESNDTEKVAAQQPRVVFGKTLIDTNKGNGKERKSGVISRSHWNKEDAR